MKEEAERRGTAAALADCAGVESQPAPARLDDKEAASARQRELIETLEARNAELRRILQVERERFATGELRAKFDGRVTIVNGDVWVEGRVLPAKVFRRIAKLSKKPAKWFFARLALALLGARV